MKPFAINIIVMSPEKYHEMPSTMVSMIAQFERMGFKLLTDVYNAETPLIIQMPEEK